MPWLAYAGCVLVSAASVANAVAALVADGAGSSASARARSTALGLDVLSSRRWPVHGDRAPGRPRATGAALFIWVWLVAAILNGAVGVFRAGIPLINEIGAFIPIFGIPAVIAWYLAYRYGH